mmetsp:Transcript_35315/g.26329  ORF Transcript_35315/g.26329 Transcript_35315/m.26329 type:complete len:182 (-) Transcript_35315:618-1163(-)|eukprot:CAMPEP_0202960422 /NCGR_PEP_ID=MMETSP1396-20130829/4565_1 /ASSEMBLY_ACC=CAM_ASM_000872 /TAXON_ID= /ORGANISM="Pseudokeronopsis sp., Strain Brazil" /LENGTH=181 /DNA_ID=CAMNT_0049679629 /DNA_START=27 /DNA_END=572 /DNA_ORIENTATION=-
MTSHSTSNLANSSLLPAASLISTNNSFFCQTAQFCPSQLDCSSRQTQESTHISAANFSDANSAPFALGKGTLEVISDGRKESLSLGSKGLIREAGAYCQDMNFENKSDSTKVEGEPILKKRKRGPGAKPKELSFEEDKEAQSKEVSFEDEDLDEDLDQFSDSEKKKMKRLIQNRKSALKCR